MNIVLIGMSGAGKTTIGVLLAKTLGMNFIDTDIVLQNTAGRLLQDIIDNDGIDGFLQLEENAVTALKTENCVIATGGSVIYSRKAMKALRDGGLIVYLHVTFEEIVRRLSNISSRGIVMKKGLSLRDVYNERVPLYEACCDVRIDCTAKDVEQCVQALAEIARRHTCN